MTTRAIVPNGDGEGSLGTSTAKWGAVYSSDPASGENSGQVPTTAWVQKLLAAHSAEAESTYATKQEAMVLPGTVTAFSGTFKDGYPVDKSTELVNREWHLCDGTNGTPDLRNRFIYGGDGTNNGATGGEASHKLTEAELPAFRPSIRTSAINKPEGAGLAALWHGNRTMVAAGWDNPEMRSDPFNTIGGNQPHNNMPPYYVLAYIMKM